MNMLAFYEFSSAELWLIGFALLYPLLVIYCLVDIVRSNFKDSTTKLIWVLIVLFAPFLGSIAYLVVGRQSKTLIP
ncbi:PLDc_N domain-containing protein [Mucilaginibacter sp. S1162]|uniref:PLDc_N domain-containing protein n=1 Tax=Mucilaginibacter humi TaxID=2732510 RepID=A0ABX1W0U5_9SPHI|nr:PLD nuclease N-terminal domain-containing protein [Mucilaginibacter humi]NNU33479.1 PLDc_N domain-containing protein [Mucilaginibacter humi]